MAGNRILPPARPRIAERIRALGITGSDFFPKKHAGSVGHTLTRIRKEFPDREYTSESRDGGVRVWRTK
jgi:hypothetical protein